MIMIILIEGLGNVVGQELGKSSAGKNGRGVTVGAVPLKLEESVPQQGRGHSVLRTVQAHANARNSYRNPTKKKQGQQLVV